MREQMIDIVHDLGDELIDLRREHSQAHDTIAQLEKRVAAAEARAEVDAERAARSEVERSLAEESKLRLHAEAENQRLAATTKNLESRLDDIEGRREELELRIDERDRRSENWRFGIVAVVSVLLTGTVLVGGGILLDRWLAPTPAWIVSSSMGALLLLQGLEFAMKRTRLEQSWLARLVSRVRCQWWAFLLAVAVAVIANWILLD